MKIEVHIHNHHDDEVDAKLNLLISRTGDIMATQAEILAKLAAQSDQLDATLLSLQGIQADIDSLKALIQNGASLDEISAAVDALGVKNTAAMNTAAGIDAQTPPPPGP